MTAAVRVAAWVGTAAAAAVPLSSFLRGPAPLILQLAAAALWGAALWRPRVALVAVALLAPIATYVQTQAGGPYGGTVVLEAAVLALLGGAAARAAFRRAPLFVLPVDGAAALLIAVALASGAAQMPLELLRYGGTTDPLRDLALRYFDVAPSWPVVSQSMWLIEGAALAVLAARVCAGREPSARLLTTALIVSGAAAAALSVRRLVQVSLRSEAVVDAFLRHLSALRFHTQFGDLNAAGSFFALVTVLAASRAGVRTPPGLLYSALFALMLCGLWITGSRTALAASLLGSAALAVWTRCGSSIPRLRTRTAAAAGTIVALAVFVGLLTVFPLVRHATFSHSLFTRLELMKAGGRMFLDRPVFGVGTAQYYAQSPRYMSSELKDAFLDSLGRPVERENAHNQFVQVMAELGAVGLMAFTLMLAAAFAPGRGDLPAWRRPLLLAIAVFILTAMAGHPLLTPMVAIPFWMALGAAASAASLPPGWTMRGAAPAVTAIVAALAVTLPLRWREERRSADLTGVTLGASLWESADDGARFRWVGGRATFFTPPGVVRIVIPLRSPDQQARSVKLYLDGRLAAGVEVPPGIWVDVPIVLPAGADTPVSRRIDVQVDTGGEGAAARNHALMVGRLVEVRP